MELGEHWKEMKIIESWLEDFENLSKNILQNQLN